MTVGPAVFDGVDELLAVASRDLGTSRWRTVGPADVTRFCAATGAEVDDGGVPPYMLVALTNAFLPELMEVRGASSGLNYGTGSVRFGSPARVGDRLRARATLVATEEVAGGVQTLVSVTVEVDGAYDPACFVEAVSRWLR